MKTASYILHLIGGIISIISTFSSLVAGILFVTVFSSQDVLQEIKSMVFESSGVALSVVVLSMVFIIIGICLIVLAVLLIANTIVSFKAMNTNNKGILITSIVLSLVSNIWLNGIGSVVALVALHKESQDVINQ